MRALRKQTVQALILLARACEHLDFGDQDATMPGEEQLAQLAHDPNIKAYDQFLDELSVEERAELTALFWLGRDNQVIPDDWDDLVDNALKVSSNDLYRASKRKMPQILRYAMERLARHKRYQKIAEAPMPLTEEEVKRSEQLVGQFAIASFKERYGSVSGMKRLIDMMEHKNFLVTPEDRRLFGLPPREKDGFESVLAAASSKKD
ncbi:MAG: DUF3775 domain-containing protein [Acidobacteria bacterium]|nr:DUF3775 domain-containing protein [Acidobacteriota bacterium]